MSVGVFEDLGGQGLAEVAGFLEEDPGVEELNGQCLQIMFYFDVGVVCVEDVEKGVEVVHRMVPEAEDIIQVPAIEKWFVDEFEKSRPLPMGQIDIRISGGILPAHGTPAELEIVFVIEGKVIPSQGNME